LLDTYPYDEFPVLAGNRVTGIISRRRIVDFLETGTQPRPVRAETIYADQSIREITSLFIGSDRSLLPVLDRATGELTGIVTRNDVLRAQTKLME
jgi:CBS domain-containing protein